MPASKEGNYIRKRKAHKKSRHGCANCKLRSVKCDETKPSCKRCESFNVVCCYGPKFSSEGLLAQSSFRVHIDTISPKVVRSPPAPLPISGSQYSLEVYQLVAEDIPLIEKFQRRTVWTLGTGATHHVYAANTLPLAFTNPLLMHAVLAMAEIHDLAIGPFESRSTSSLTYHWYNAISSMRRYINKPVIPCERDMLWVSASLIGISALAYVEARSPEEAWPLRPPSPADLSWFTLCDGQMLVAQLTDPMRADSAFFLPAKEMRDLCSWVIGLGMTGMESKERRAKGLPRGFERFFGLSSSRPTSLSSVSNDDNADADGLNNIWENNISEELREEANNIDNNPYYVTAKSAAELFMLDLDQENFLAHICFVRTLDAPFRNLLIHKDEKAMLLLLYWYAKICDRRLWWLWKQSCTEGLAIYRYLERVWTVSRDEDGLALLELPRMRLMTALRTTA
ncbi:hypothetical protein FHL15_007219 [Xylaria flabelliformis]|uniref:Zn(2)-C6 fungal-type domain-containing protein n=1 Tax=Xylaria flabelliformis TaxID=2512241 RepID=A0A553HVA9_9PEZI|nr:hypothetical protein FHL15_007219 [Xylaria flabelliformis]